MKAKVFDAGADDARHRAALVFYCEIQAVEGDGILLLRAPSFQATKPQLDWPHWRLTG